METAHFATFSVLNHSFQGSRDSTIYLFRHTFLGLLLGACFFVVVVVVGVTFGLLLVLKVVIGLFWEATNNACIKRVCGSPKESREF